MEQDMNFVDNPQNKYPPQSVQCGVQPYLIIHDGGERVLAEIAIEQLNCRGHIRCSHGSQRCQEQRKRVVSANLSPL